MKTIARTLPFSLKIFVLPLVLLLPASLAMARPPQITVRVVATAPDGSSGSDRLTYKGDCNDKRYHLQYVFKARTPGTYTYREIFGGKDNGSVSSIVFEKHGEQTVDTGIPTENVKDLSIQVQVITKPVLTSSNKVILSSECKAGEAPAVQPQKQPKKSAEKSVADKPVTPSALKPQPDSVPLPGKCYSFDSSSLRVADFKGRPSVVADAGGSIRSLYMAKDSSDANEALAAAKTHSFNEICYTGTSVSFSYFLSSGGTPKGSFPGEKCVQFNPENIKVAEQPLKSKNNQGKSSGSYWALLDGVKQLRGFGTTEDGKSTAYDAQSIIKAYIFNRMCTVGGFSYFLGN